MIGSRGGMMASLGIMALSLGAIPQSNNISRCTLIDERETYKQKQQRRMERAARRGGKRPRRV